MLWACRTPIAGLNDAGAAFVALRDGARREFLSEVERFTTTDALFKFTRMIDVKVVLAHTSDAERTLPPARRKALSR
jgi:hypothetical protein